MTRSVISLGVAAAALALAGCGGADEAGQPGAGPSAETKDSAGGQTIAAGLDQKARFFAAAKAAGLDATLGGPGPYTVLVADDAAFGKLPAGTAETVLKGVIVDDYFVGVSALSASGAESIVTFGGRAPRPAR